MCRDCSTLSTVVDRMPREQNTLEVVGPNPISGVHKMVLLDTSDFTEKKV